MTSIADTLPEREVVTMELAKNELVTTHIAGLAHYEAAKVFPYLRTGMPLKFIAEPTNAYDQFAIEVFVCDTKLGYVPAKYSRIFSVLRKNGIQVHALVSGINVVKLSSVKPYPLFMSIYLIKE